MGRLVKRVAFIDILKGFAMMSVVFGHITCQLPFGSMFNPRICFMWHVPLFFMLSVFFITERKVCNTKTFVWSKFKGLYVKGLYYVIPVAILHNVFVSWDWYRPVMGNGIAYGDFLCVKEIVALVIENFFLMNREPIVGAMWFIDVLFLAMICFCAIKTIIRKFFPSAREDNMLFGLIVVILVTASNIATNIFDLTITKLNNSITAIGLLFLGQQLYQSGKALYINKYSFMVGAILLWQLSLLDGGIALNTNNYTTCVQLVGITLSAYYTLVFIAKKIEKSVIGKICVIIGENSFAIMGLHFVGFKMASIFLSFIVGSNFETCYVTTPNLGTNYIFVLVYFGFSIVFPLIVVTTIKKAKSLLLT